MSVAGLTDLPLEIFSGLITDLAPATLPPGASPAQSDFAFILGAALTRPGLGAGVLGPYPGTPKINYVKTYTDQLGDNRLLFLDSLGVLRQEFPQGTVVTLNPLQNDTPASYATSITLFGREYIACQQGGFGIDIPRQFDGTNYDRISQVGPGAGPAGAFDVAAPLSALSRTAGVISGTIASGLTHAAALRAIAGIVPGSLVNIQGVEEDPSFNGAWPVLTVSGLDFTAWGAPGVYPISALVRAGGVVTATLSQPANAAPSDTIVAVSVEDPSYNGVFVVASVSGNEVTWNQAGANGSSTGGQLYTASGGFPVLSTNPGNGVAFFISAAYRGSFVNPSGGGQLYATIAGFTPSGLDGTFPVYEVLTAGAPGVIEGQIAVVLSIPATGWDPTVLGTIANAIPDNTGLTGFGIAGPYGGISAGVHQLVVIFVTRQGYLTMPSPPTPWTSTGGFQVLVQGLPQAPYDPNVIARIVAMTAANAADYRYTLGLNGTPNMSVPDAATTSTLQFGIADTALLSGEPAANLFNLLELGEVAGVLGYSSRLFAWGERNKVQNFLNLTFDGGTATDAADTPLGWTLDPTSGVGGSSIASAIWDGAWEFTGTGAAIIGMLTQPAYTDQFGAQIILPNTAYSARIRIARAAGWIAGNVVVELYSPSKGSQGTFTVNAAALTSGSFVESIGPIAAAMPVVPPDLLLRVYANGTPTNAATLAIDNIELFPTLQPFNNTIVRASYAEDPESFDGLTGFMNFNTQNSQTVRSMFVLREKVYAVKDKSMYETEDDGQNEPNLWSISEISNKVGTPSVQGVDVGEEWAMIAARQGLYIFWGPEPVKISQEIQTVWDSINWNAGATIWVKIDDVNKRTLVGVPINGAASPNRVLMFDYRGLDTAQEIADHWTVRYSSYTGKILAIGNSPKWSPWTMSINSATLAERNDGTAHLFMGNGAGTGKIYDLLDPQQPGSGGVYNDDGAGIPWTYSTYFVPGHTDEQALRLGAHRKLFGYLTGLVEGSGQMDISMQPIGNSPPIAVPPIQLVNVNAPAAVTQQIRSQGTLLVTCAGGHGLQATDTQCVLAGMLDPSFDGAFPIGEILNPTQFTVYQPYLEDLPNLGAGGTVTRRLRDFEFGTNVLAERVSYTFSNHGNTPNTWVKLQKVIPSMAIDPWAPVRGGN